MDQAAVMANRSHSSKQAVVGRLQQHVGFRRKGPAKIGARLFLVIIFKAKVSHGFFADKKKCISKKQSDHLNNVRACFYASVHIWSILSDIPRP